MKSLISKLLYNNKFPIYKLNLTNDEQEIIKTFDDKNKAIEFLKELIDSEIKDFVTSSLNEYSFTEEFILHRKHIYNIENAEDFNEIEYIKQKAAKIFKLELSKAINSRFKVFKDKNEEKLFKDIEDCNVKTANDIDNGFEIIYYKNEEEKSLTIKKEKEKSDFYKLSINNKKTDNSNKSKVLRDIKKVIKIFHLKNEVSQQIELIYQNDLNQINSYRFTLEEDEIEQHIINISKYENIFNFSLDNGFEISYDNNYIYIGFNIDIDDNLKKDYDYYYPCAIGKRIRFYIDSKTGIKVYNTSNLSSFTVMNIKDYDNLNSEIKTKFLHFLSISELYINSLFVNQTFDNEIIIKNPEQVINFETTLKKDSWEKKLIFSDNDKEELQTKVISKYQKEEKFFIELFESNLLKTDKILKIKFNNNIQEDIEKILNELDIEIEKKVEVWTQKSSNLLNRKNNPKELRAKFKSTNQAIQYIENELNKELINIIKKNKNITTEELIEKYKQTSKEFFLKNSEEHFSSIYYVTKHAKVVLQKHKYLNNKNNIKKDNFFNILKLLASISSVIILHNFYDFSFFSLNTLIFFILSFSMIFLFVYFISKKNKQLNNKKFIQQEEEKEKKESIIFFKKTLLFISIILFINTTINYISYKTNLFDEEFKYINKTKKAVALSLNDLPRYIVYKNTYHYLLYKKNNLYFLVKQKDSIPHKKVLTLYENIELNEVFNLFKYEKEFIDIIENMAPFVYKEVTFLEFIFKPLYFSNNLNTLVWNKNEKELIQNKYMNYIEKM